MKKIFLSGLAGLSLLAACTMTRENNFTTSVSDYEFPAEIRKTSSDELVILTLNLHTYQESQQDLKFDRIAYVINQLDIDLILFQECAQHKNSNLISGSTTIREDNMAKIVCDRLSEDYSKTYFYAWDWSHYGWSVYEEGVALLSKTPVSNVYSIYVSASTSTSDITSRKIIFGQTEIPGIGTVQLTSAHLHWRTSLSDLNANAQVSNTKAILHQKITENPAVLSIVGGDFNCNPTSSEPWSGSYFTMMSNSDFRDTFLDANPWANTIPALSDYDTVGGDYPGRIDYIFMMTNAGFEVLASQIIFKASDVGTVSDHFGVVTKIRMTNS